MQALELVLVLLAATAVLNLLAEKLVVPPPVLLVLGGTVLALIPGLPRATLSPEVVFLVFVPPLLYWTAYATSWRDFRANLRSITFLAVGLVLVTMVAIAVVVHGLAPGLPWAAAFALGAIVSPPDPVAVSAVTRKLGIPRDITTVLEGEGLLNDATALVAYRMAVAAVVAGGFSLGKATLEFLWAAAAGIAWGLLAGWLIWRLRAAVRESAVVSNTFSILSPFVAFIPAEKIGASGVVAVVVIGLYAGRQLPRVATPQTRTQAFAMWEMIGFFLEGIIFILIGLELPFAVAALHEYSWKTLALLVVAVSVTAIVVRFLWLFPAVAIGSSLRKLFGWTDRPPPWRGVTFASWAGLRGGDSLVIALSLPLTVASGAKFPGRDLIIFLTFSVIFVTLVLQGLTLKAAIRWLGLKPDPRALAEEAKARARMADAGLSALEGIPVDGPAANEALASLEEKYRHRVHRYEARLRGSRSTRDEDRTGAFRRLRLGMIDAEREALVKMRDGDEISDDVMRTLQNDLDLEQVLLEHPESFGDKGDRGKT